MKNFKENVDDLKMEIFKTLKIPQIVEWLHNLLEKYTKP
jgi:pantothenate kinase